MKKLLLPFACCLMTLEMAAQVVINEVCASNLNGLLDSDGDREDWFELYNPGPGSVNLSGWFLSDNPNNPQKWVVPSGQTIAAGAYLTVFCSGKDKVVGTAMHTNFKLTQTKGESVVLTQPNGTTADFYTFVVPNQVNHSWGRSPNGSATWKIFTTPTPGASNIGTSFDAYSANVVADKVAGFYPGSMSVNLSTDPGLTIRYTTNGSEPTPTSTVYSGPVNIAATTVLKARAYSLNPQVLPGFVDFHTYFINVNHSVPVVSIAGTTLASLLNGTQATPIGSFEYFENNLLESEAYGVFNKHGNDSWAYPQRGVDWITRDQLGYDDELNHEFFEDRTRKKFQRLILKAAANDNYPSSNGGAHIRDSYVHTLALKGGMNVDVRTHLSCILYVNGQYWGVYDLREKADDADFTKYYFDQDEFDIDYIKTWGSTWQEYGSWTDWYTLKAFILGNNMAVPANYAVANQQLDFLSLIDYVIINQHTVCKDWLNWNTAWWRGRNPDGSAEKWRYALWDMDATFGHYINYTGIPDVTALADPCDVEQIPNSGDPQNHIDIFMALYANPQFKALYVNRYADLLNTSLSCDYMQALLDEMINEIAPEMPQHIGRWGGNLTQWNQNVNTLRNFINTRCQILEPSIVNCYDVTGPFDLTVHVSPVGSPNNVMVNTITPTGYPFIGSYFGDIDITLLAKPGQNWLFDHWEVSGNTFGPNQLAAAITLAFQTNGVVTAFFVPVAPCNVPSNLTLSIAPGSNLMDWADQPLAMNYKIRFRETGETVWQEFTAYTSDWDFDVLPGCTDYEGLIQTVCPQGISDSIAFAFSTPDYLQGFALNDADFCNAAGTVLDATFPGASYLWNNGSIAPKLTVTAPGDYWVTVALDGCVRTDTSHVTQLAATASLQPTLCPGQSFSIGGETFDAQTPSGQVLFANMAANGCDSLVQVNLQFLTTSESLMFQTSCNPAAIGVDTVFLTNAVGCDSLIITTTSFAPLGPTNLSANSCNPNSVGIDTVLLTTQFGCDSLVITTTLFDANAIPVTQLSALNCNPSAVGVDTLVLTSTAGCDSLVVTTTTLEPSSQTSLNAFSCNPNLVGVDTLVLANQFGCDSLVITTTLFDASAIPVTQLSALNCNPAAVGVDTLVLTSAAGCDSLVVTTTTLAPSSKTSLNAFSCNPNLVGVDTLVLANQFGCDSLVITTTLFDASAIPVTQLSVLNCNPAAVGVDTLVLTSTAGCDSLVVTTTTLAPSSQTSLNAFSCNPNLVGVDTLVLANQFGCDSLVITTTLFDASAIPVTQLSVLNCNPAAVGVDTLVLTSAAGCDSLVVTTTTLAPSSQTSLNAFSCNPNLVGVDTVLLVNQYGCDSLVITTTIFDPTAIVITQVSAQNCDPALVGLDTLVLTSTGGCDSIVITTTTLLSTSQINLTAISCEANSVGIDTLVLTNQYGCDSLVITNTAYAGLDFDFSSQNVRCHGGDDAVISLDTVLTPLLPVEVMFENQSVQFYNGIPLVWEDLSAGVYSISATNTAGCTVAQTIQITEGNPLQLDFGQSSLMLHLGDSIWVKPTANFLITDAAWSPTDGVNCPNCPATYLTAHATTTYTLTATDANGCSISAKVTVVVNDGVRVYVPTAFRPGSGGPNESFTVFAGPEVERVRSLKLFDRWGGQVFEQSNLAPNFPIDWDGTYRGQLIQQGVLVWFATIETIDGRVLNLSGDITVLR